MDFISKYVASENTCKVYHHTGCYHMPAKVGRLYGRLKRIVWNIYLFYRQNIDIILSILYIDIDIISRI